jgi:hypothetical protein
MTRDDLLITFSLEKSIVNRKNDIAGRPVSWLNTREIHLKKESPDRLFFSTTVNAHDTTEVSLEKRQRGKTQSQFITRLSEGPLEKLYTQLSQLRQQN